MNTNRMLTGSSGNVWVNGRLLAQVKGIELKVTGNFEEVTVVGSNATYNKFTGWTGEGTMSMHKIDSTVVDLVAEAYLSGVMPDIKIVTSLTDKATKKAERVSVSDVVITEFMLAKFESKALAEEEMPLKFSKYQVLEKIA